MTDNHVLVGTKVKLVVGDIVVEEEPEEDGFIRVKSSDGTVGHLPISMNGQIKKVVTDTCLFIKSVSAERPYQRKLTLYLGVLVW